MKMQIPMILGLTYFLSEVILSLAKRSQTKVVSKDANSLRVLWIAIGVGVWMSIQARSRWPQAMLPPWCFEAGIAVFVIGILLRWYSIIHLGRFQNVPYFTNPSEFSLRIAAGGL